MRRLVPSLIATSLLLTGCSSDSKNQAVVNVNQITAATMITLPEVETVTEPRIVAVGNGSAEILVALGLQKLIVGRDIASEIEELANVPIVTNGHDLSAEKVLLADPDLLIIDPNTSPRSALAQVERAGVEVIEMPERFDIEGIYAKIRTISRAIGESDRGDELIAKINQSLAIAPSEKSPRVLFLYLRGSNGIFLVGGKGSGADALIDAAGGVDIGSTLYKNPFTPINSEAILGLNPDLYLVMSKGLDSVGGLKAFRKLPGIKDDLPVIAVDDSLLLSFGARTADLIAQLSRSFDSAMRSGSSQ